MYNLKETMSNENVKFESITMTTGDNQMQDALIPQIAGKRPGKKASRYLCAASSSNVDSDGNV